MPGSAVPREAHQHACNLPRGAPNPARSAGPTSDEEPKIVERAGLRHISWKDLRHTFATELTSRGVPIRVVQELLGHTTITMTARYAHVSESSLQHAVSLLTKPPAAAPVSPSVWSPGGHQDPIVPSPINTVPRPILA
ncbi:MAG: tyrosine-type recombinase/integrase [Myxococcales bacterium]|nr:tyrosine-type recombinase/integrase [Myxococcales bacterium]